MSALMQALEQAEAHAAELAAAEYRRLVIAEADGEQTDVDTATAILAAAGVTLQTFRDDVTRRQKRRELVEQFAGLTDAEREQREHTVAIAAEVEAFEELHRLHRAKVHQLNAVVVAATETVRSAREAERQLIATATDRDLLRQRDKLRTEAERLSQKCTAVIAARQTAQCALGNAQLEYRAAFQPTPEQAARVQKFAETAREKEAERVALSAPADVPGSVLHAHAAVGQFEKQHLTAIDA
ncbi:MAG: hypothetical protein SH850_08010 [Planctomycetaceae bacterium]|nr:hypothetical protein [Planctomycetaceae bacterium]